MARIRYHTASRDRKGASLEPSRISRIYLTTTSRIFVHLDFPDGPSMYKFTIYSPAFSYRWMGCRSVDVAPSPKSQRQDVIWPEDSSWKASKRRSMSRIL